MLRITDLKLPLEHSEDALRQAIITRLGVKPADLLGFTVFKRSYDARKRGHITLIYALDVELRDEAGVLARLADDAHVGQAPDASYRFVARAPTDESRDSGLTEAGKTPSLQFPASVSPESRSVLQGEPGAGGFHRPLVIGFGPCGLFVALLLAQMGFRPIVLERGKAVRERTKDTWGLWRKRELNPDSNVQFGEGGAGTFSDGKLYSQIRDPQHHGRKVLTEFVAAGAPEEILYVSKPHIGTFKLVSMIEQMRENIIALGGDIRFSQRVDDLLIEDGHVRGVTLADGTQLRSDHVVLAVGHSARDTFEMLHGKGVFMEAKPFSIGFRTEHPQSQIDACRFGPQAGHPILGAADYKLVHHCRNGRSVYSFCMCPGGTVVAATSEPGRVVTNGMSQYSRNERNANSAIVVGISPTDYPGGPLAGIELQRELESRAFVLGGGDYNAPAQLFGDFLAGKPSTALGDVQPSYKPGVTLTDLSSALPAYAIDAIREAIPAFGRQIRGYDRADAIFTGVETRTSSPLRVTRGDDFQSLNVKGLYPAGEGAGYAGGILSAGVDGIRVAEAVALSITAGLRGAG